MKCPSLVFAVAALFPFAAGASIQIQETLITGAAGDQFDAHISTGGVVWTDTTAGTSNVWGATRFGTGIVASGVGDQEDADIFGDNIVYVDASVGNGELFLFELATGTRTRLTLSANTKSAPALSGNQVVYLSTSSSGTTLRRTDLASGFEFFLAGFGSNPAAPDIDGNLIVWQQFNGADSDVWAAYVGGAPFLVAGTAANEKQPSVSGDLVAYIVSNEIEVLDLSDNTVTRVTNNGFTKTSVFVRNRFVYWGDTSTGNADVFAYDLADGATYQLTTDPFDQSLTDAHGTSVVFNDNRLNTQQGSRDIWQLNFSINEAPTADAGPVQSGFLGTTFQLNGSGTDPDGDALAFKWTIESAPAGSVATLSNTTIANPTLRPDRVGEYVLALVVSDGANESVPARVTITVVTNNPPVAVASATPLSGLAPLAVNFTGSLSSDPEGLALTYAWNFGDFTPTANQANPAHTYQNPGIYTATLTVTDNIGQTSEADVAITVTAPNGAPDIAPTATPNSGPAPLVVQFAANASDAEGDPLTYAWNFGDPASGNNTSTAENPAHTYARAGAYTAWLTVSDGQDETSAALTIVVEGNLSISASYVTVHFHVGNRAAVNTRIDFAGPGPQGSDLVAVRLDGDLLVAKPLSAFLVGLNGDRIYREKGLMVRIRPSRNEIVVFDHSAMLPSFNPANGGDIEVMFGNALAVENVPLQQRASGHYVYRR